MDQDIHVPNDVVFHPSIVQQDTVVEKAELSQDALTLEQWKNVYQTLDPVSPRPQDNQQPTLLFGVFMSRTNFDRIQKAIQLVVFRATSQKIGQQSQEELLNLMQQVYINYARNTNERGLPRQHVFKFIRNQVARLNKIVTDYAAYNIVGNIETFKATLEQQESDRALDKRPISNNIKGTKQYREIEDVLQI